MANHAFSDYERSEKKIIGNGNERYYHTDARVLAEITQTYRNKLKLAINGLTHAATFQGYLGKDMSVAPAVIGAVTARICDADPASGSAFAGLNDAAKQNAVRQGITAAINPHATTCTQLDKIKDEVSALDSLLKAPNRKFSNEDIAGYLTTKKTEGVEAIKAQHKREIESITNYFGQNPLPENLTAAEATALKTEALEKLDTEQREQITSFERDLNKSINTLNSIRTDFHNMQAVESQRLFGDKTMRDAINMKAQTDVVSMGSNGQTISIEGLKLSDIQDGNKRLLHCFSGRNARITKDKDGKDATIEFDISRWLGMSTVHKRLQDKKAIKSLIGDFTNTAQALKAEGFENITCKAHHPDEDTAKLIARCEYEGALRGGFSKEKIKLKVNGKDVTPDSLFTAAELKKIHDDHDNRIKSTKDILGPEKAADSKAEQAAIDKAVQEIVESNVPAVAPRRAAP